MERYKSKLNEKQRLIEMAYVGTVDGIDIQVYTDHPPEHFHATKKDEFEAKISIDTLEVIDYKWQKAGKEISSSELKAIKRWMSKPYRKDKSITNLRASKLFWSGLNP